MYESSTVLKEMEMDEFISPKKKKKTNKSKRKRKRRGNEEKMEIEKGEKKEIQGRKRVRNPL